MTSTSTAKRPETTTFSIVLPMPMRRQLFAAARHHDRSAGAEAREALRRYFAQIELDDDAGGER